MSTGMQRHYVVFESPGTLFSEMTEKPVAAWDTRSAVELASAVVERHGARPYGFRFETRLETAPVLVDGHELNVQPKLLARSGVHYLVGEPGTWALLTLEDAEGDPKSDILASNMRSNAYGVVFESRRSFRYCRPFEEADVLVDDTTGDIVRRGDEDEFKRLRADAESARDARWCDACIALAGEGRGGTSVRCPVHASKPARGAS